MSKVQSQTAVKAPKGAIVVPAEKDAPPARRLGRGLSSLLGTPVKVDVPPAAPEVMSSGGVAGRGEMVAVPEAKAVKVERRAAAVVVPAKSEEIARSGGGDEAGGRIVMVRVESIVANRFQPRRKFDEAGLRELAASIRAAGVVQPILVRKANVGEGTESSNGYKAAPSVLAEPRTSPPSGEMVSYELIAGERRWRASKIAGLTTIPAVVADLSDEQAAEWALIENVQRAELQPLEQAHAIKQLCERFGHTHAQAADKLGLDRSTVTNLLRLTELEPAILELMDAGKLTAAHAKVLLGLAAGGRRVQMAELAAKEDWSVRELTVSVIATNKDGKAALGPRPKPKDTGTGGLQAAGLEDLQKQLSEHLGTKVQIRMKRGGKSGDVVVRFYDLDHFDGLMGKMGFVMR